MEPLKRIAIVGHGLIGGSIGLALRHHAPQADVVALDRGDALSAASGADLIVLAAPVLDNIQILQHLGPAVPGEALVTDTGSTKAATVAAAEALPPRLRFVGGHPVAGAAAGGADGARPDLFAGRRWILTPTTRTRMEDLEALRGLIESFGASLHLMDAEAHDRLFAYISHLPQLTLSALMHVVGRTVGEEGLRFSGAGLRDSTRLAASPPDIWSHVVQTNHTHIAKALDALISTLQSLRNHPADLGLIFEDAAEWKKTLEKTAQP